MIVTGPLMAVVTLGLVSRPYGDAGLSYLPAGSVVMSLMFQSQNNVAGNFASMKTMGTLVFFATLPVHRHLLILATVTAFLLLSIPALLVTVLFGAFSSAFRCGSARSRWW